MSRQYLFLRSHYQLNTRVYFISTFKLRFEQPLFEIISYLSTIKHSDHTIVFEKFCPF